eukprot:4223619-Amphidinium_carterae.1
MPATALTGGSKALSAPHAVLNMDCGSSHHEVRWCHHKDSLCHEATHNDGAEPSPKAATQAFKRQEVRVTNELTTHTIPTEMLTLAVPNHYKL